MNHLNEEQLILHYYGEEAGTPEIDRHLAECPECRALDASLKRTMNLLDSMPVPERTAEYGAQVWQRVQPALRDAPSGRSTNGLQAWLPVSPWRWAAAAAVFAALLVAAFLAGRSYPRPPRAAHMAAADPQAAERILLVAVGDYLERSQMVLIELANADPGRPLDISSEQGRALDLVSENRLYRQTAAHTGDSAVTGVLDELERVLLDITHAPSQISPAELDGLHQRLKAEGILFKVRVLGSNVRHEELEPARKRL